MRIADFVLSNQGEGSATSAKEGIMAGAKHGAWCHIEIPTSNAEAAKRFYGGLFRWTFTFVPEMNYTIYTAGDGEIGGGLFAPPPNVHRRITNYVNVDDLEAAVAKVPELGGRVIGDTTDVPGHGRFRIIADPEGNELALWQSLKAAPAPRPKSKPKAKAKKTRRR